jgi:hypothetical protein
MLLPKHNLTQNFQAFFKVINPSPSYVRIAATAHASVTHLIEDARGPAADLRINCFLQGSYRRDTAIYTINDVDVVALCSLAYSPTANQNTRNQIFKIIADAIAVDGKYENKIVYRECSVCIKVLLEGIKIEILPVLREKGQPYEHEPFFMFRASPDGNNSSGWRKAFAREHQRLCTQKNDAVAGLFIPMVKALKHMRSRDSQLSDGDAISFHIECLLFAIKDSVYQGSTAACIESVLHSLAGFDSIKAANSAMRSPCQDKGLFSGEEWRIASYSRFHRAVGRWCQIAHRANLEEDREKAIDLWKELLGRDYFPRNPQ